MPELKCRVQAYRITEPFQPTVSAVETPLRGETDAGVILGTVSYMSPEQARGEKVDPQSDIFSVGIVLHEMLTGTVPFRCPSAPETLNAIINTPAPSLDLTDHKDSLPELQRIVHKCLAKDRAERYQSIKEVVVDLRAVRRELESGTKVPVSPASRKGLLVGAVAVVALLAVLVLVFFWPEPQPPDTSVGISETHDCHSVLRQPQPRSGSRLAARGYRGHDGNGPFAVRANKGRHD